MKYYLALLLPFLLGACSESLTQVDCDGEPFDVVDYSIRQCRTECMSKHEYKPNPQLKCVSTCIVDDYYLNLEVRE